MMALAASCAAALTLSPAPASHSFARTQRPRGSPRLATIEVVGSVRDIINGVVRPEHTHQVLDPTTFRAAFLVGSPRGLESMGEMICVNGHAFTCSTDPANLHQTVSDSYCWTSGARLNPLPARGLRPCRLEA
jgi:hypothetical protein